MTFSVNRNPTSPTFDPSQYSETLSDNYPLATEVLKVNAVDPDGVSEKIMILTKNCLSVLNHDK